MKNLFFIVLLAVAAIILTGCDNIKYNRYDFDPGDNFLPEVSNPYARLIKDLEDFEEFLEDENIFPEGLSEDLQDVNEQFDESFFDENYLVAVFYKGSSSTKSVKVRRIYVEDSALMIVLKASSPKRVTQDIVYFTFYLSVNKEKIIKDVDIKVK